MEGFGIDIAPGALDFEVEAVKRAIDVELLPGTTLHLCAPEDLIVMKVFADRPLDWEDVKSVIIRQRSKQQWDYIYSQLEPLALLKESPEITSRLRELQTVLG